MKNKLKLVIVFFLSTIMFPAEAQTDSASFYLGGIKEWFYQQKDVFSFTKTNKTEYLQTLPSAIVEKKVYGSDGINYIYFKNNASLADIQTVKNTIKASALFEKEYMVLTKDWQADSKEKKFIPTCDIVEIVFNDENITEIEVNTFATQHFLELVYTPVKGGVYIFRVNPKFDASNVGAKLSIC